MSMSTPAFLIVGTETVGDHLAHRVPVGDDQTVEAPLVTEHILEDECVTGRRDSVVVIERGHESHCPGLDCSLERRQIDVSKLPLGKVCAVVIAPSFGGAIAHEMLDARRHGSGVRHFTLITPHHGFCHPGVQPCILSAAFSHASPTGVAGDVEHRRESPAYALRRGFDRSHPCALLHQSWIERRRKTQGNRENGMETVNDVTGHQKRDPKTGLLHADTLEFIYLDRIHLVEY